MGSTLFPIFTSKLAATLIRGCDYLNNRVFSCTIHAEECREVWRHAQELRTNGYCEKNIYDDHMGVDLANYCDVVRGGDNQGRPMKEETK